MTEAVTIDEGLERLQQYTVDFLKGLHAYIIRVEERKALYRELRRLALSIGLTEAELPPPMEKARGGNKREWTPEQREAAAERMRTRNLKKAGA